MSVTLSAVDLSAYRLLVRAADAGDLCPTNPMIIEAVGLQSPSSGARLMARLESAGMIEIERGNCTRVVKIVATGKKTAGEITNVQWRHRAENAHLKHLRFYARKKIAPAKPITEPKTFLRVDRTPCSRCGVRADVGCSHQPAQQAWAVAL